MPWADTHRPGGDDRGHGAQVDQGCQRLLHNLVGSGPLATVIQDLLSLLAYFSIANALAF
jgi:hypothetical protein